MKNQHSKNWGGPGRGQGRKPSCGLCKTAVTKEQLALGDAFHFSDGSYYHQNCLEDQKEKSMSDKVSTKFLVSHGDIPDQLKTTNQNLWYVVKETWQGSMLLSTDIVNSYTAEAIARTKCAELQKEADRS